MKKVAIPAHPPRRRVFSISSMRLRGAHDLRITLAARVLSWAALRNRAGWPVGRPLGTASSPRTTCNYWGGDWSSASAMRNRTATVVHANSARHR